MKEELLAHLGFSHFVGVGPTTFAKLKARFKTASAAYHARQEELQQVLELSLVERFIAFRTTFNLGETWERLQNKEITVLVPESEEFPETLRHLADIPICLYIRGDAALLKKKPAIAVVGTRTPSTYGKTIAQRFAEELASYDFTIISGLAYGIDSSAHEATLDAGGRTIAILGGSVDAGYPSGNRELYQKILASGGLIVSEFPPGHAVKKGMFVTRNRLVSGLSDAVLVVEGSEVSGALITARYAAEQGREVFAVPGEITSPLSRASTILLKQGAHLASSVEDILEVLQMQSVPRVTKSMQKEIDLNDQEKVIFKLLSSPHAADEIIIKSKLAAPTVLQALSSLELKGAVEKVPGGKYQTHI